MTTFGERLRQLRQQHGLTQTAFGHFFNMRKFRISQYELDKRQADDAFKKDCALFFNISLDYLMGLTDIPLPLLQDKNTPKQAAHLTLIQDAWHYFSDESITSAEKDHMMKQLLDAYLQSHKK